ncbi:hypothetical protein MMC10_000872 [Thelotrema lepadinum]|nr:hypothetical protein [Thelotrema lepadinum]
MSESETKAGVVPENSSHEMESSKDKADSCLVEVSASVPDHTTIVHLNKMSGFCNKLVRWSDVTEKELKSNGTHELAIGNEFIHKFARICEQIQSIDNWTTKEATSPNIGLANESSWQLLHRKLRRSVKAAHRKYGKAATVKTFKPDRVPTYFPPQEPNDIMSKEPIKDILRRILNLHEQLSFTGKSAEAGHKSGAREKKQAGEMEEAGGKKVGSNSSLPFAED